MDEDVDVKFLRTNTNGFKNAENELLALGWKEKRFTRATNKDIKRAYFVYLVKEKAKELQRSLTRDEVAELETEALELKDTKMYVRPRASGAAAASMNNSEEYAEEEAFIPENERLEMIKRIRRAERPKSVAASDPRIDHSAARLNEIWGKIRAPPKAKFPNVSLNLPNNSDKNYQKEYNMPLNNVLRNFNKLNIGERNHTTLKRKRNLSPNSRRVSHKRSYSINALRGIINAPKRMHRTRFNRRRSKFSNLPSATRKKYMRRFSRKNK